MFEFDFTAESAADLFADFEPATPTPKENEPKELKPSTTDLKSNKRIHAGTLKTNHRNKIDYIYLNETKADIEKWTVQLMKVEGIGSISSLTYSVKEFSLVLDLNSIHSRGIYIARFTGMKRKQVEGLNHITLNMQLCERDLGEEYLVSECINEIDWPKGKPLHELWEALANSTLELLLGVENKNDNSDMLISGKLQ